MEMIVREAEKTRDETEESDGSILPPMKALFEHTNCLERSSKTTSFLLQSVPKLIK